MNKLFHVVIVEPNSSGGLIHYAYQMSTALADEGIKVNLITGTEYELENYPHNFKVENILNLWTLFDPKSMKDPPKNKFEKTWNNTQWTLRRIIRGYRLVREWVRLTTYLKNLQPDIIQFGKINFPFEALFLRYLKNKGLRLTQICHEFERRESSSIFASVIDQSYRSVYHNFSRIFFHAKENQERFLSLFPNYPPSQTYLIPHGNEGIFLTVKNQTILSEDVRKIYQIPPGVPVVLFFGILSPSKGLDDLIDAFKIVRNACDSRLIIAGYPTKHMDIDGLRKQILTHNLEASIILDTRYIPSEEVGPLMKLSTVVVYPYKSSTQSGALQVAYSFGRPVIATSVGGLPEVVEDGLSGYLVPPRNPEALAEKIQHTINNRELASQMGRHAEHLSKTKFGWRPIAKTIISVYQELIT